MNKTVKTVITVVIVLLLIGACIGGFFIWRHNTAYIGKKAAISIALDDIGVNGSQIKKAEADFEKNAYSAWYEVEIKTHGMDYDYDIDARTGEILSSYSEIDD